MTSMFDLGPAARQMTRLLDSVSDRQLDDRTPCPDYTVGDLIEHIGGLALAFTWAAAKDAGAGTSQRPSGDASRLGEDWRARIPEQLSGLEQAWRDPDAWQGMTRAGGIDLPSEVAGQVAINELVIHGWDLARASNQDYAIDARSLEACLNFVTAMSDQGEEAGRDGLFGPVVPVSDDAPDLDRAIGLSGRDPGWVSR